MARFNIFEASSKKSKFGKVVERLFLADMVVMVISLEKLSLESLKNQIGISFEFFDEDDIMALNEGNSCFGYIDLRICIPLHPEKYI